MDPWMTRMHNTNEKMIIVHKSFWIVYHSTSSYCKNLKNVHTLLWIVLCIYIYVYIYIYILASFIINFFFLHKSFSKVILLGCCYFYWLFPFGQNLADKFYWSGLNCKKSILTIYFSRVVVQSTLIIEAILAFSLIAPHTITVLS